MYCKDGKYSTIKKASKYIRSKSSYSQLAARVACIKIDWYTCNVDDYGNYSNCTFQYSELVDCHEVNENNEKIDYIEPSEGGGPIIEESAEGKTVLVDKLWYVCNDGYAKVTATDDVIGVKTFSKPQTKYNYFKSIQAGGSFLTNKMYFITVVNNHTLEQPATWGYSQTSHAVNLDSTLISAAVAGHYTQQNVDVQHGFIPSGNPHTVTVTNTKTWLFSEVFP